MSNNHPEVFTVLAGHESNSPSWHKWRQDRALTTVFASQAAAVLGEGKFKPRNRRELYLDKHGLLAKKDFSYGTNHGHRVEPIARAWIEKELGEVFVPQTRISECERFVASPDGVTLDGLLNLEIKCPVSGTQGELWDHALVGEVPRYYYWQCVQQAALSDCLELLFVVYAGDGPNEQRIIRLNGNDLRAAWHKTLKPALIDFLEELKNPLAPDECQDPEFLSAAVELAEIDAEYKALEKRREAAADRVKAAAKAVGTETVRGCGYVVSKVSREGAVDYKKLLAEHQIPDTEVEKFRKPGTSYLTVRSTKEAKA